MILALIDDLMFTSKIRATAHPLGVSVVFARSKDSALAEMTKAKPVSSARKCSWQRCCPSARARVAHMPSRPSP